MSSGHSAGAVDLRGPGGDALVGELADRVAEEHLLLGEAGRAGGGGADAHGGHPSSAAVRGDARGRNVRGDIGERCA